MSRLILGQKSCIFVPPVWKLHNPYCHKWTWSILPFQQLYENSYSLHPINCMASTGNGRAPVRQTPEDQPTIVRFDEFFVWRKNLTNCKLEWQHSVFNYLRTFIYFFEDFYQYSLHIYFSIWFTQGWLNC